MRRTIVTAAVGIAVIAGVLIARYGEPQSDRSSLTPFELLRSSDGERFPRVETPWDFRFPADHGSHDEYRTEWWQVAGVVQDGAGTRLGVQLIIMRLGLAADAPERSSPWAATDIYGGMFSISDPAGGPLRVETRTTRAALDAAGAMSGPVRVWLKDWRIAAVRHDDRTVDWKLDVAGTDVSLEIELRPDRPLVDANGIRGNDARQNAPFQFYVQPWLNARGILNVDGEAASVTGVFTLEHAWGELPLLGGPVAQDRFTLHLADERALLCLRLHDIDASVAAATTCTIVDPDGRAAVIPSTDVTLTPTSVRTRDDTHAAYPTHWTLRIPRERIDLQLIPYREDEVGDAWLPFWAGPVALRDGTAKPAGDGFVQLHGYAE